MTSPLHYLQGRADALTGVAQRFRGWCFKRSRASPIYAKGDPVGEVKIPKVLAIIEGLPKKKTKKNVINASDPAF